MFHFGRLIVARNSFKSELHWRKWGPGTWRASAKHSCSSLVLGLWVMLPSEEWISKSVFSQYGCACALVLELSIFSMFWHAVSLTLLSAGALGINSTPGYGQYLYSEPQSYCYCYKCLLLKYICYLKELSSKVTGFCVEAGVYGC